MNNNKHRASYLVCSFLSSKRSLRDIYSLNSNHRLILYYLASSLDIAHSKTKKNSTVVFQSQIARYTGLSSRTVNRNFSHLIKKKLLTYLDDRHRQIGVGKVLLAYANLSHPLDVRQSDVDPRYTPNWRTTYASNKSNKSFKALKLKALKASRAENREQQKAEITANSEQQQLKALATQIEELKQQLEQQRQQQQPQAQHQAQQEPKALPETFTSQPSQPSQPFQPTEPQYPPATVWKRPALQDKKQPPVQYVDPNRRKEPERRYNSEPKPRPQIPWFKDYSSPQAPRIEEKEEYMMSPYERYPELAPPGWTTDRLKPPTTLPVGFKLPTQQEIGATDFGDYLRKITNL